MRRAARYVVSLAVFIVLGVLGIWLARNLADTIQPTTAFIVTILIAAAVGLGNTLWPIFTADDTKRTPDETAEAAQREEQRRVTFNTGLAGVTLAGLATIAMVVLRLTDIRGYSFLILSLVPGAIGFCNHIFSIGRHFALRQTTVDSYKKFREAYDHARRGTNVSSPLDEIAQDETKDYSPDLAKTLFASLLVTAVFLIPASVAWEVFKIERPEGSFKEPPKSTGTDTAGSKPVQPKTDSASKTQTPNATDSSGNTKKNEAEEAAKNAKRTHDAVTNAVAYGGLGAYLWTLYLIFSRINAGALTAKFLINTAVRVAMGLGLAVAVATLNGTTMFANAGDNSWLLLLVGVFPLWAMSTLRRKAKEWFGVNEDGCETLPICLVDGLDDGLIDLLNELSVGDVEHLATADPGELTLQTLFPLKRVADWIDQAILIQEVRGNIVEFRKVKIRTATDFAFLYGTYAGLVQPMHFDSAKWVNAQEEAAQLFDYLAKASGIDAGALRITARRIYDDYFVNLLWNLWNMPGSVFTGWVAEMAEWLPVVFAAAGAAAIETKSSSIGASRDWDATIDAPLTDDFRMAFQKHLTEKLSAAGYQWTGTVDDIPKNKTVWREVIWAFAPYINKKAPADGAAVHSTTS